MPFLVLPQCQEVPASTRMVRVRGWIAALLARASEKCGYEVGQIGTESRQRAFFAPGVSQAEDSQDQVAERGTIIQFPRLGRARLFDLMESLKQRFADIGLAEFHPFLLSIEEGAARSRLWIDGSAYVEFFGAQTGYRVVLDDAFDARITLETHDFDSIASFVGHYIVARLSGDHDGGVAS